MTWVHYTVLGIVATFVVMFFISCAILQHLLDRDDDDDRRGGWY